MQRGLILLASVSSIACGAAPRAEDPFGNLTIGGTGGPPTDDSADGADTDSATSSPGLDTGSGEGGSSTAAPEPTSVGDETGDSGPAPASCGNAIKEGDEVCDLSDLDGQTCADFGFQGGTLTCFVNCAGVSTDNCYICGNGTLEGDEDCENGEVPAGVACDDLGFDAGDVTCGADCFYDTSQCSSCGDGVAGGIEDCDGVDLAGQTCAGIGFDEGDLACNANCSFSYAGCSGGNYIQDFEGGVLPGEFATSGNANWIVDSSNPIAGAFSAASGIISHSQTSNLTLQTVFAIDGTVEFTHEESSEGSFDYLEFWIDGALQQEWAGINAAQTASFPVTAGAHTLEWRYTKDGSVNSGSDRVWVDDIVLTGGTPV